MPSIRGRVEAIVEANPNKYLQIELAREVGVTRERIRQIINEADLRHLLDTVSLRRRSFCTECGKPVTKAGQLCIVCYHKKIKAPQLEFTCDNCGNKFRRNKSEVHRQKFHFCSKFCQGRYAGRHYGFAAHGKTARKGGAHTMEELDITEINKSILPLKVSTMLGRKYAAVLERAATLDPDKALKIKCPSRAVASSLRMYINRRSKRYHTGLSAFRKTEPEGIIIYVYKETGADEGEG